MRIDRIVDIDVRVGEGRSIRMQEEVSFEIGGEEAVQCVFASTEGREMTKQNLKYLLNNFARFIKAVPKEEIAKLEPEVRLMIAGFLEETATRFYERAPGPVIGAAVEP